MKIGQRKYHNGNYYTAKKATKQCSGCVFHTRCNDNIFKIFGSCSADERADTTEVIFVKVGEENA